MISRIGTLALLLAAPAACAPMISTQSPDASGPTDGSFAGDHVSQDATLDTTGEDASPNDHAQPGPEGGGDCGVSSACGCANLFSDPANCGSCGHQCPTAANAAAACMNQICGLQCNANYGDCDGNQANGCETPLLANSAHCGSCGNACPAAPGNGTESCVNGACMQQCTAPYANCGGSGCSIDTATDPANCGSCGHACPSATNTSVSCVAGQCTYGCVAPYTTCGTDPANGCTIDPLVDIDDCGGCGHVCPSGEICRAGLCGSLCIPVRCGSTMCPCGSTCCGTACCL